MSEIEFPQVLPAVPPPIDSDTMEVAAGLRSAFHRADEWFAEGRGLFVWQDQSAIRDRSLADCLLALQYHNHQVWHFEDLGRTDDDAQILLGWRGAMRHNRSRNELINEIDARMVEHHTETAPLHSESLGALADRITILHLKYRNYRMRDPATAAAVLEQRDELVGYAVSLEQMLRAGRVRCQLVPRLKLYLAEATSAPLPALS